MDHIGPRLYAGWSCFSSIPVSSLEDLSARREFYWQTAVFLLSFSVIRKNSTPALWKLIWCWMCLDKRRWTRTQLLNILAQTPDQGSVPGGCGHSLITHSISLPSFHLLSKLYRWLLWLFELLNHRFAWNCFRFNTSIWFDGTNSWTPV